MKKSIKHQKQGLFIAAPVFDVIIHYRLSEYVFCAC